MEDARRRGGATGGRSEGEGSGTDARGERRYLRRLHVPTHSCRGLERGVRSWEEEGGESLADCVASGSLTGHTGQEEILKTSRLTAQDQTFHLIEMN